MRPDRQRNGCVADAFSDRKIARAISVLQAIVGHERNSLRVIDTCSNAPLLHVLNHLESLFCQRVVKKNGKAIVTDLCIAATGVQQREMVHRAQIVRKTRVILFARFKKTLNALELFNAKRRRQFAHAIVIPKHGDIVDARNRTLCHGSINAKGFLSSDTLCQQSLFCDHHASFGGGNMFHRIKRKTPDVAK